jgi:uncharacterized protein
MSQTINIDRFTRSKQSISGQISPEHLPRLAEYLAGEGGEIRYSVTGNVDIDAAGGQVRRVKCIIYGWFLLSDPLTLAPIRHDVQIDSSLILVNDESELPPLEMESEFEDYIICGTDMDIAERVEEEILLSLPSQAVSRIGMVETQGGSAGNAGVKPAKSKTLSTVAAVESRKISPFAKLAKLKTK